MACGVNTKVCSFFFTNIRANSIADINAVDYILFISADVTVNANLNEVRDYKYVNKGELQAMFEEPGSP